MNTIVLQIPLNKNLRDKAKKVAEDQGFSSLQEAVRIFLNSFSKRDVEFGFHSTVEIFSKNETRYNRMVAEVRSGKVKTKSFSNPQDFTRYLTK